MSTKKNGKFFKKKMWKQNKIFVYKGLFRNILNTINVVVAKKKNFVAPKFRTKIITTKKKIEFFFLPK